MALLWRGNKQNEPTAATATTATTTRAAAGSVKSPKTKSACPVLVCIYIVDDGPGPVAFLVSRKFTAASHPFCLGSLGFLCSLFAYFFFVSSFFCIGILFVGKFFTDLRAAAGWQGCARMRVWELNLWLAKINRS